MMVMLLCAMTGEEERRAAARLAWLEINDLREKAVVLKDWPVAVAHLRSETTRLLTEFRTVFPDLSAEWEDKKVDDDDA